MEMTLTVTASWTKKSDNLDRIDIAGYTAIIETITSRVASQAPIYEITVFHGSRIVATAHRTDHFAAFLTAERIIEEDVVAQTVST